MVDERPLRIGVLALQGGVAEHLAMLRRLGAEAVEVRLPAHLEGLRQVREQGWLAGTAYVEGTV